MPAATENVSSYRHRHSGEILSDPDSSQTYSALIVNLAPTGLVAGKHVTRHVPLSPQEIVEDACRGLELGAAIVHLHARDARGAPTYRAEVYETMILGIREHFPDAVLCVSCIGNDFPELELRSQVLELTGRARPDMASLAPGSFDLPKGPNLNPPEMVIALLEKMTTQGIKPELECFDSGMVNSANLLIRQGRIHPPFYFNLLLGSRYGGPATARHLAGMVADLPPDAVWAGAGIGRFQLPVNVLALAMGGHCRTGLEDNIYQLWDRSLLATNAMLVRRIAELAETFGRPLASQVHAREMLGVGRAPVTCPASASDSSEPRERGGLKEPA